MADIDDVELVSFDDGVAVVPASEMKQIVIPSPPTVTTVPTNPRACYIVVGSIEPSDEVKAFAKESKVVIVIPEDTGADTIAAAYTFAKDNASKINIKKTEFFVKAVSDGDMDAASEGVEAIYDADDNVELDDPELLSM
ncbi:MAG: hypothetical protein ACOX4F_09300 [Atopobiaceae bacterium]|jgi:hypothetical protein